MKLSIVIPVYNVEHYLKRCVDSVLTQKFADYEVILVDDGSTDNSGHICDDYALANDNVYVIHKSNGGLSSARNAGIDMVNGDYFMLLDSDDWIADDCLNRLSNYLNSNYDLIMGRAWTIDVDGNKSDKIAYKIPVGLYVLPDSIERITSGEVSFCSQFYLYRTEFITSNKLRFYEGVLHEDELWMPCILLKAKSVLITDVYFYFHFVRIGSIMHSNNFIESAKSTLIICKLLSEEYECFPNSVTKHLRDRLAMLYLRAIPQLGTTDIAIHEFGRFFALKNSFSIKQKIKALCFFISPKLYCKLIKKIRGY